MGSQSVEKALRCVAQTLVLAGYPDPRRSSGMSNLDLPFTRLLAGYWNQDPAPQPQLALPVMAIEEAGKLHTAPNTHRNRAAADLTITSFFFLLRVGEYTMPKPRGTTRTVQFRVQDATF
jgi:hypothetical protein